VLHARIVRILGGKLTHHLLENSVVEWGARQQSREVSDGVRDAVCCW
jgi:hypothetical protein